MQRGRGASKLNKMITRIIIMIFIFNNLFIGIIIPTSNGASLNHDMGNLEINMLTDFGRILMPINWNGRQTVEDQSTPIGFIGLVIDHDSYDHTPGIEDIADSFSTWPYVSQDDFNVVNPINFVVNDPPLQKSVASFRNEGVGTGDPNDIIINQTCWTVTNKDWAIIQWTLTNVKSPSTTLTNVRIGLEVPISQEGGKYGLGGNLIDHGDDVDGYDAVDDIYWAQDIGDGTTIGFGSAIVSDPITHYFAQDYDAEYQNASNPSDPDSKYYKNFFGNDSWLYQRITAPNAKATNGITPQNITATVGWDGFDILSGESRTVTLVVAINNSLPNMVTAIKDAQNYYHNVATGFQLTEIRDSGSGSAQIEVFNNGREPTDPTGLLTMDADGGPLTGSWSVNPIPTYGYSTFIVNEPVNPESASITLFENAVEVDRVSYGQKGTAPDPLDSESTGRRFDTATASYSNDWLRDATVTWDSQNDVGNIITLPQIVLNRVLFYPFTGDDVEEYVELMYTGMSSIDISGYKIVCDDEYIIPATPVLNPTNRYYVFRQVDMPSFFTNMDPTGDNVYLYDNKNNLQDMVGWSSLHNQGEFMSRIPNGTGTHQGYNDSTSQAAGWVFDNLPSLILTEFYADSGAAEIELYNPRGGDKVLSPRWTLDVSGGTLLGNWNNPIITWNGYERFIMTPSSAPGDEGDTISLYYLVSNLNDQVSYGTSGVAPDPLGGESTARFWDSSISGYNNEWSRDATDTFGSQNNVPAINSTSWVILNEVMFNPTLDPDGKYVVLINIMPFSQVNISNFYLVCDDVYQLPTYPTGPSRFDGILYYGWTLIIRYGDDSPSSDAFFHNMDVIGDNVYMYNNNGELLDMVGWNTAHTQGTCVRRIPDGNGTYQGYHDTSSVAAGWVFDRPLKVLVTEISDSESAITQIEVYNPWYPTIDFTVGFTFESFSGITGSWVPPGTAGSGQYAVFDVTRGLDYEGDTISFTQNSILIDEISYGQNGLVPDPLIDESVERYWDGAKYTNIWERNWSTGPNFGIQNDVPPTNLSSAVLLNEIMFNPTAPGGGFVSILIRFGSLDISGYKIVCDSEFIVPFGIVMGPGMKYFNLTEAMDPVFFANMAQSGDNVYLYDDNGSLLDMAGWSTLHTLGKTMKRVPDGNGTRDGYNDTSSIAAGWVFDYGSYTPPPSPPAPPRGLMAKLVSNAKDVMLLWNASSDDGSGEDDVVGYTVYKSATGINGSYGFAAWIFANDSLTYNWIDSNAGDEDWNDYFYMVRANDTENNQENNTNKAGKFVNYLYDNWNLFSVPLIQFDNSMNYVLQTIEGNYTAIQGYHAGKSRPWLHWHKKKPPQFNDIIEIDHKSGYYIKMTNPDYLVVVGAVPVNTQISLKTGWNLIGYPCLVNQTVEDALSSISGKYNMVEYFDPISGKEVRLNPDDLMEPGLGYWIHTTEDCTLVI